MRLSVCLVALMALAPALSGCSVDSETWVNQNRLEVHEDQFTDTLETGKIDDGMLHAIGVYYYRFGNGPLTAAVSYDPKSAKNNLVRAKSEAARIEAGLHRNGVKDVLITTTPAAGSGDVSTTVITFAALTARAPTGCDMMPGYDSPIQPLATADGKSDYDYGCTVETLLSRQVSRPSDMLGKPGFDSNASGRRQADVVEMRGYYSEKSNPPLEGETASKD